MSFEMHLFGLELLEEQPSWVHTNWQPWDKTEFSSCQLHGISCFRENRGLATESFQHLSGSDEAVSTFSNGNVEDELLDLDVSYWVWEFLIWNHWKVVLWRSSRLNRCTQQLHVTNINALGSGEDHKWGLFSSKKGIDISLASGMGLGVSLEEETSGSELWSLRTMAETVRLQWPATRILTDWLVRRERWSQWSTNGRKRLTTYSNTWLVNY